MVVTSSGRVRQAGVGGASWEGIGQDGYRVGINKQESARRGRDCKRHCGRRCLKPRSAVLRRVVSEPSSYKPIHGRQARGRTRLLLSGTRRRNDTTAQHSSKTVRGARRGRRCRKPSGKASKREIVWTRGWGMGVVREKMRRRAKEMPGVIK